MPSFRSAFPLVALAALVPDGAGARTYYPLPQRAPASPTASPYVVQPLSDADLLADQIRALTVNPQDLTALVRAGELALKIGDNTAAAAFFARAERIDPRNARAKAGEGSLLVAAERPGEALRRFAEAEALGGAVSSFAADRGLAYDLTGEPDRAQRDYRVALRTGVSDETQRRYALSLGIAGKRGLALAEIDQLLRRSDRGAWRARAFILAMTGDQAGADKIATTMMPAGMAEGLQPFFVILPTLSPADRAFAVHFGEVRATPERVLDARLAPKLAVLGPDPTAPVEVAAVVPKADVPAPVVDKKRKKRGREPIQLAVAATPVPVPVPLPQPPAYNATPGVPTMAPPRAVVQPLPSYATASVQPVPRPAPVRTVTQTATLAPTSPPPQVAAPVSRAPATVTFLPPGSMIPRHLTPEPPKTRVPVRAVETPVVVATKAPALPAMVTPVPTQTTSVAAATLPTPVPTPSQTVVAAAPASATAPPPETNVQVASTATVAAVAPVVTPATAPRPVRSEDSILNSILADIVVPPSELADATVRPVADAPSPTHDLAAEKAAADRAASELAAREKAVAAEQAATDKAAADKKAADKKLADKKAADKKLADKKAADAKAAAAAKKAEEARKHDPKFLEPARVWVQVAGGATEGDLGKAWAAVRAKSTSAFKGKSGWTTPLRATNRVLAGPFASDEEAQAFVNKIAGDGISGFVFTSTAGQKITKLPAK